MLVESSSHLERAVESCVSASTKSTARFTPSDMTKLSSCAVTRLIVANDSMNFLCRARSSTFCGAFPIRPSRAAFSATKSRMFCANASCLTAVSVATASVCTLKSSLKPSIVVERPPSCLSTIDTCSPSAVFVLSIFSSINALLEAISALSCCDFWFSESWSCSFAMPRASFVVPMLFSTSTTLPNNSCSSVESRARCASASNASKCAA
mmetsp:Transcript_4453/g.12655  ORF Transcript_4453/g.12655 Transcript_4453/m.12655 type:complete len:209 (+) Transcript_4453:1335-1961(+)